MTPRALSGPRLPPQRGKPTHLIVLLHGYGADGNDLIGLAPFLQRALPTAAFVAPNAPERCEGAPSGHQWFAITRLDPKDMRKGVESASASLDAFLDSELARLELPPDRLALLGFSQGTMMSLHVGLSRKTKPMAIVGFSGLLAGEPPQLASDTPPVLLIHGDQDPMIPVGAMFDAAARLGRAGACVQWHVAPGIGHSIDETGLQLGAVHLTMALRGLLKRSAADVACALR